MNGPGWNISTKVELHEVNKWNSECPGEKRGITLSPGMGYPLGSVVSDSREVSTKVYNKLGSRD
jgi:hypothetical protein